jgi:branched-chain amino acid aminotransferase
MSSSVTGAAGFAIAPGARHTALSDGTPAPFGSVFAPWTASARWTAEAGWEPVRGHALGDLVISPAAMVLHYGQAIFEGLKAFRSADGGVAVFRPDVNARRFRASARRMAMPELPEEMFLEAVDAVVVAAYDAVPADGGSLYLRPFMIATEPRLGTRPAREHLFQVLASPVGTYFAAGERGISVLLSGTTPRAFPGGTGAAKCAGNYAASLQTYAEATAAGYDQVAWLDAREHRYVEELGGMNVFFVHAAASGPELVTPPVSDTLLAGVTRQSLLELAPGLGLRAVERPVDWTWWRDEARAGRLTEAFACGTAAAVTPIGAAASGEESWTMGEGGMGPVTRRVRERLLAVQHGEVAAPGEWLRPVTR